VTAAAIALAVLALPGAAAAAPAPGTIEETPVRSVAPDARHVTETFVRVYDPLPASAGAHPEACDWVSYLRFRHPRGPRRRRDSDAVTVLMPGFIAGAAYFDQVARNTVRNAAAKGRFVEVWALDRRSNCLEDHTGVRAAARAGDPAIAFRYYWGGETVDGRRFAGFAKQAPFLAGFGLERTVRDWYAVVRSGIPDRRVRARKLLCGGHSLGGPLTTAFAGWDFDGDPRTTDDAGYNQCAAFVGLDTRFSLGGSGGGFSITSLFFLLTDVMGSPYINATPLTPETFQIPAVFGVGAYVRPRGTDNIRLLPHTLNIDLAQRLLFSRDAVNFATGIPSIRDFNISNEATLGGILDDNSAPLSFLRVSAGSLEGGPLVDKDFPFPGGGTFALPGDTATPLYGWQNYDRVGAPGVPLPLNEAGTPYTTRESEVSDIRELARTTFEAPANFIEQYFPTRISSDVDAAGDGSREGGLANLRHDGVARRPALLIIAGDSQSNAPPDTGPPIVGTPPNGRPGSRRVTIPGYNHNDTNTAARIQNDGRPEPSSTELTAFMLRIAGPAPIRLSVRPRGLRAGRAVRVRFALARVENCTRGVAIRAGGHRVRTNRRGRASLRLRPRRRGTLRIVASKRGCRTARTALRVR
jgi:hypothetical protein